MNSSVFDLILQQTYLHLISYGLVLCLVLVAVADAFLVSQLKRLLRREGARLSEGSLSATEMASMVHPLASAWAKCASVTRTERAAAIRPQLELAEAALFVPLRARMN